MRILIQRVSNAEVSIEGKIVSSINTGLLIFLGIENEDSSEDIDWLSRKVANIRLFNDEHGMMNLSVKDVQGSLLVVSQFTLQASTKKGNRPSYIRASRPEIAVPMYKAFVQKLEQESGIKVKTGKFGAMMDVSLVNDGPVTIFIDSKSKE